jgi:hypothetical protein
MKHFFPNYNELGVHLTFQQHDYSEGLDKSSRFKQKNIHYKIISQIISQMTFDTRKN